MTNLTLAAWALVEVGVRVREGVQGKGRVVLPLPAIVWRIQVEEAELNRVMGQASARTRQTGRA